MDQEPGIRQNSRFTDQSGSGNPDRHVNRPDVLRKEEEPLWEQGQVKKHVVMVGSWPCMVSSEVHINGRCVSDPVQEDKGKATVLELEDEKDLKRTCMVLSKGHKVVGSGYSRLSGDAARATDRGGESGNPNWVDQVHREYDMDRWIDRVTQDSRGNRDGYSGRRTYWVSRDSWGNRDGSSGQQANRVTWVSRGNRDGTLRSGNSSQVTQNLATTESRGSKKSANTESRVTEKSTNMKSRVTGNSANTENFLMQELGSRKPEMLQGYPGWLRVTLAIMMHYWPK
jgi:hypothetical protein